LISKSALDILQQSFIEIIAKERRKVKTGKRETFSKRRRRIKEYIGLNDDCVIGLKSDKDRIEG
jgi:hypothetical protein